MLIRIMVPAGNGAATPESAAFEAPYGLVRREPSGLCVNSIPLCKHAEKPLIRLGVFRL